MLNNIIKDICAERTRQDEKWGQQDHDEDRWLTILVEEVGEVAKAIQDDDPINYLEELTQVAAVAVAALEAYYRKFPPEVLDD